MQNHQVMANDLVLSTIRKADEAARINMSVVSDYNDKKRASSQVRSSEDQLDETDANYISNAYRDSFMNDSRDEIFTDEYERAKTKKRLVEHFQEELGSKPDKLFDVRHRQSYAGSRQDESGTKSQRSSLFTPRPA